MLLNKQKERRTPSPFGKGLVNSTNHQAMEWLKGVNPAYASHVWQRNGLVQAICVEKFGGVDALSLPVCEKCEKPGAWHDDDSCWCFPCGHQTKKENTKTLYRYIAEDSMPHGMDKEAMDLLHNMLVPTLSGALADMFKDIENLEFNQYQEIEGESEGYEDVIEEIETDTDDSTVSDGED